MRKISVFIACSALWIASSPTLAGDTWHEVPGGACSAFNNAQADELERDHVRISLPINATRSLWVICPVQAVAEDLQTTVNPPEGYVNAYFAKDVPQGTVVSCNLRLFPSNSTHVPGDPTTPSPDAAVSAIPEKTAVTADAQADFDYFLFLQDWDDFKYYTVACQLAPGTGINSISFRQR